MALGGFRRRVGHLCAGALLAWFVGAGTARGQFPATIAGLDLAPFVIGLRPVVSNGAVGGVAIDAAGVLAAAEPAAAGQLRTQWLAALEPVSIDLAAKSELRKISLRRLRNYIVERLVAREPLPDEVRFLAGLQRVRYVFAYPDRHDIVLAGPAEEWTVDARGNLVGATSRRPTLLLDDLIVALRFADDFSQGGIACSIDPTVEGLARLQKFVRPLPPRPSRQFLAGMAEELGQQQITVRGVPETTHFARVLVAADYRMKRIAMNLERSPIENLPSYLQLYKGAGAGVQKLLPRWWLAADYEPLLVDPAGLAWELRGQGIQAMSEDDYLDEDGSRRQTGKTSDAAAKWAGNMTARYDRLAGQEPVFGELRNVTDLAVVAALILKQDFPSKTHCNLDIFTADDGLPVAEFHAPATVSTQVSLLNAAKSYVVFASGGVGLDAWGALEHVERSERLEKIHAGNRPSDDRWWWD